MPERVEEFPKVLRPSETWDGLVDGEVWRFGPDEWPVLYKSLDSMKASAHHYGTTRGYKTKAMVHEGAIFVQFTKVPTEVEGDEVGVARQQRRQARIAGRQDI